MGVRPGKRIRANALAEPHQGGTRLCSYRFGEHFIGKSTIEIVKKNGVTRRLRAIAINHITRVALGNEPVRQKGQVIGRVKSGGQGHSIGKSIAYACLSIANAAPGTKVEIEIFEPTGERIKA